MYTGEDIRVLRMIKGFSQQGVARQLGISQPAYCKLEKRENLSGEILRKVLAAMGCTESEISKCNEFFVSGRKSPT